MADNPAQRAVPTTADVREEVQAWLAEHWDPERSLRDWRNMLADSGWGCPAWPLEWHGRGLPASMAAVVSEEFRKVGAVGAATGVGMSLAAPTILDHGSDDLKRRLLRPLLTGEHPWCQLFSEPGNGSDLAGLTTRAERDGDEWIVNGQKVWNSGAHKAQYGMLLARTDWDVPKHGGISYFAIEMKQPGVEVRPLRQMNGRDTFNEVFLTDARVADANMIGVPGGGWRSAVTTLANERSLPTGRTGRIDAGKATGRCITEAAAESADYWKTYEWYPQRNGRSDLAAPRARAHGLASDQLVRQQVAELEALNRAARWTAQRGTAARVAGRAPGPEGSIGKLTGSNIARMASRVHSHIVGAHGMLSGLDSPLEGIIAEVFVSVPGQSIAGGTDEIQHNIIGERSLGLPKEPSLDADLPFRQVRTNRS